MILLQYLKESESFTTRYDTVNMMYDIKTNETKLHYFQSTSNNRLLEFITGMERKLHANVCLKTAANSGLITQVYRNSMSLLTRYAQDGFQQRTTYVT